MEALTTSKRVATPDTSVLNDLTGITLLNMLTVYSSVFIPLSVFVAPGFPIDCVVSKEALRMAVNCSNQFSLVLSFQLITVFARLLPSLSKTLSVVDTLWNLINPLAGILRLGL